MRIILFILIFFTTNVQAQNPSNYDRIKQDPKIANADLKIITLQTDVNNLKVKTVAQDKEITQLKLDNAKLNKRLDSIRPVVIVLHPSTGLIVSKNKNDTITIYKAPTQ